MGTLARELWPEPPRTLSVPRLGQMLSLRAPLAASGLRSGDRLVPGAVSAQRVELGVAELVVVGGPAAARVVALAPGEHVLGSAAEAEVELPDPSLAGRHARLLVDGEGGAAIVDEGAASGTAVEGVRLRPGEPRSLGAEELVQAGETVFSVRPAVASTIPPKAGTPVVFFNRPPRVRRDPAEATVRIPAPPGEPVRPRLQAVASLVPLVLGAVLWRITGSATMLLFMTMSPVMLGSNYLEDRRRGKRFFRRAAAEFRQRLHELGDELDRHLAREVRERRAAAPALPELLARAEAHAPTLWERRPGDPDFLTLRTGTHEQPSLTAVALDDGGAAGLRAEAEALAASYATAPLVPATVPLAEAGVVGLCGPRARVDALARSLVVQAATLHSPRDVVIAAAIGEQRTPEWEWLKWLPHVRADGSPLERHVAVGRLRSRELLESLLALVAERRAEAESQIATRAKRFHPFVLVLVDEEVAPERALVGELLRAAADVSVGVVWLGSDSAALPGECRWLVELAGQRCTLDSTNARTGELAAGVNAELLACGLAEECARALAPVRDVADPGAARALPERVGLLELLGGERLDTDWIEQRWLLADGLRAVVGVGADGPLALDLRADGPHGLVAGTTGAGKSELLQTLIASLAATVPPTRLTFLLVDYKGGAAFKQSTELPHTVGFVTDLDPHLTQRALISLNAELRRREQILHDAGAKDLAELERRDPAHAPASLVIVIDEFATLAKEVPDFVAGVVDVAQRGRSLGVHLLLATQRPAGVVNDNIKANTNLRIALRVGENTESSDVIGVPDAARIPRNRPGRAYVRTGHSELTELQAAFVGGITEVSAEEAPLGVRPFTLDEGDGGAHPDSGVEDGGQTDLRRLVVAARLAAERLELPRQPSPWLPALPAVLPLETLEAQPRDGIVPLGLLDEPTAQRQRAQLLDLDRDGNLLVFGSSGSGKTTLLRTVAVALAGSASPAELHLYALDFASRGLAALASLPHCAGVLVSDESERIERLFGVLRRTIDERKALLARDGALSFQDYRRLEDAQPLPRIVVLLDGYAGFQSMFEKVDLGALVEALPRLVAEGRQLGVHFVISVERRGAVPPALAGIVQSRVVLRLTDEDDYRALGIDPRSLRGVTLPPGRGFGEGNLELQCALAGEDPTGEAQAAALTRLADRLRRRYPDTAAPPLETLPLEVPRAELDASDSPFHAAIGVAEVDLGAAVVDLAARNFLVAGPYRSGRSTALLALAESLLAGDPTLDMHLLAPRRSPLPLAPLWAGGACGEDDCAAAAGQLAKLVEARRKGEAELVPLIVFVDDAEELLETKAAPALEQIVRRGRDVGVCVVAAAERHSALRAFSGWLREVRKDGHGLLLAPDLETDGELLGVRLPRRSKPSFPPGRGYLVDRGSLQLIQVALPDAVSIDREEAVESA